MTGYEVICFAGINPTDPEKVSTLVESIRRHGWQGMPILVCANGLITGSHRVVALRTLAENWEASNVLESDIAEDVSDIVDAYCEENDCVYDELPFDNLRKIFKGTWVEAYKDEIEEW